MSGPLAGVRVLEFAGLGPVPFAAMLLADLGAQVVRVDRAHGSPAMDLVAAMTRSRPSITIDLKHPEAITVVRELIADSDILLEGFRPGVMERLGLGPRECLAAHPGLVYGRMTGWGQDGPWAARAGHDITYAAITGALHLCGPAGKPMAPVNLLADFAGGSMPLVIGVLAALRVRDTTGQGQVVDAAMVDGAAYLATMFYEMHAAGEWRDQRGVNLLDGGLPCYDTYECADGRWVAVGALEPQFWAQLNEILGVRFARGQYDPQGYAEQRAAYERVFRTRTRDEWAAIFEGSDACVAPVLSLAEAPEHPHLRARGSFADLAGRAQPRVAPRFSVSTPPTPTPPRPAGADTLATLRARGIDADRIAALLAAGVIAQTDQPA